MFINVINTGLRIALISMIRHIGQDTFSALTKSITIGVFVSSFFNTAILLLLVNANMSQAGVPGGAVFQGDYPDFNSKWYADIGSSVVQTMIVGIFMAPIEFCVAWGMKVAFRFLDRGVSCDPYKTKKNNIQNYVLLYGGPGYLIHFKYSMILNTIFVTCMYGVGMPILFPIGLVSLFVLYCNERLTIAYFYMQPPSFDQQMTRSAIRFIKWAVVFFVCFGYWQISNKQMFDSVVIPIKHQGELPQTGHVLFKDIRLDHAFPMFLFAIITVVYAVASTCCKKCFNSVFPCHKSKKIEVDENLPDYFSTLPMEQSEWILAEASNLH